MEDEGIKQVRLAMEGEGSTLRLRGGKRGTGNPNDRQKERHRKISGERK